MKSIVRKDLEPKIFKTSLLTLIVFAFTMSSPYSSLLQIIKSAEAAELTDLKIIPTSNIVNERSTYDIFFKTTTTGTIKTIEMEFPSGFDVSAATKLIEKGGIGSGSLSAPSSSSLVYTVSNAISVAAGTIIRLEIGRVVNSDTASASFKVTLTTKDASGGTIDGPTSSASFPIKAVNGDDVSPGFMIRKTLKDDAAGNAHGWNPNNAQVLFFVSDSDIDLTNPDSTFVSIMLQLGGPVCSVVGTGTAGMGESVFAVRCNTAPQELTELHYVISKLPPHVIVSSASATATSSESTSQYETLRAHDQIASEFP